MGCFTDLHKLTCTPPLQTEPLLHSHNKRPEIKEMASNTTAERIWPITTEGDDQINQSEVDTNERGRRQIRRGKMMGTAPASDWLNASNKLIKTRLKRGNTRARK